MIWPSDIINDKIRSYFSLIHYHVRRLVHPRERQDAFADGLVAVWRALQSHRPGGVPLDQWVSQMIIFDIRDGLRQRNGRRGQKLQQRLLEHATTHAMTELRAGDERGCMARLAEPQVDPDWLRADALEGLLRGLSRPLKEVMRLCYGAGLNHREIGDRLNLNESTISTRHKQALAMLREKHAPTPNQETCP